MRQCFLKIIICSLLKVFGQFFYYLLYDYWPSARERRRNICFVENMVWMGDLICHLIMTDLMDWQMTNIMNYKYDERDTENSLLRVLNKKKGGEEKKLFAIT